MVLKPWRSRLWKLSTSASVAFRMVLRWKPVKRIEAHTNDELRAEYDLRSLRVRKLGPGRKSFGDTVRLEPDARGFSGHRQYRLKRKR
jgi:hypothetical protein